MNAISDDDVSIDELQKAVEHMHGVPSRRHETRRSHAHRLDEHPIRARA
jgi:hypothetical protein